MVQILKVKNLKKKFQEKKVLEDVSFSIESGEIVGFIGENGSGKTTTFECIVGLTKPDDGDIIINNNNIRYGLRDSNNKVGYVPDNPYNLDMLTGREYLSFIAGLWQKTLTEEWISSISKKLNMTKYLNVRTGAYSYGTKKKLSIISALVHSPNLLILDEPLNGIDPISSLSVLNFMKSFVNEGNAIIYSTHDLHTLQENVDRVLFLKSGNIQIIDSLSDFRDPSSYETLSDYYISFSKGD